MPRMATVVVKLSPQNSTVNLGELLGSPTDTVTRNTQ
jgi:hypothetical protein